MNFIRRLACTPFVILHTSECRAVLFLKQILFSFTLAVVFTYGDPSAHAAGWSCVPYARSISSVSLTGDAWKWWDNAAGRYERGNTPQEGAVLVFKKSRSMRRGHVAIVQKVIGPHEILIDHANWSQRGKIERNVTVIDVSKNNDWSQTRVWHAPSRSLGSSVHPTFGFIYP